MQSRREREREDATAATFGILGVIAVVVFGYPQLVGALPGAAVGAAIPWRNPESADDKRHWRGIGAWVLVAAAAVTAAYFLLGGQLGADRELRRFGRQWGLGHVDPSTLFGHPWGWVPLFCAAALGAYGLTCLWRMR